MTRPRRRRAPAAAPRFSQVEASPPVQVEDIARRIRLVPQNPTPLRSARNLPYVMRSLAEYVALAPPWLARVKRRVVGYPRPFRRVQFHSWDGTELTAWIGIQKVKRADGSEAPVPREGLLIIPGMFTTKDNAAHRHRALRFFNEWGYHVLVLDLRGMGESKRVFNTAGWKESEDVEAAVDFLRAHAPVEKVHIYSESLGAVAALLAAAHQARRGFRLIDGAILAIAPFPDAKGLLRHLTHKPLKGEGFAAVQWFFTRLLELGGRRYPNFGAYLKDAAKSYGTNLQELYKRSSVAAVVSQVNVPTLIVTSADDPVVPASQTIQWRRALRKQSNPALLELSWGSHCLVELLDPVWYWTVLHEFFDFYCVIPPRPR